MKTSSSRKPAREVRRGKAAKKERRGLSAYSLPSDIRGDNRQLRGPVLTGYKTTTLPPRTNHLERALRPIPMERKNWLFCWKEIGAEHVGIAQSLISTCRLQGIDPYTYLVDVLQRIDQLPASRVEELTPRLWKQHFADNPLRSDLADAVLITE